MKYIYNIGKGELEDTTVPVNTQLNLFKEKPEPKIAKANYGNVKIIPNEKSTYPFDTPQGIDHVTKVLKEDSPDKLSPKEEANLNILNKEMKLSVLKDELGGVKKFDGQDKKIYPHDPEQKRRLKNISDLEKSLGYESVKINPTERYNDRIQELDKKKKNLGKPKFDMWKAIKEDTDPQNKAQVRKIINEDFKKYGTKFMTPDEMKYLDKPQKASPAPSSLIPDPGFELLETGSAAHVAPTESFEQFYARRERERNERQFNEDLKTGIGPLFKIHKRKFT